MRRVHFAWTYLVVAILLVIYGFSFVFSQYGKNNALFAFAIVALCIGAAMIGVYLILYFIGKKKQVKETPKREEAVEEEVVKEEAPKKEEVSAQEKPVETPKPRVRDYEYAPAKRVSYSVYDSETIYVRKSGYGPVLRIEGNRILDMRDNAYYRIEGNRVKKEGSGPEFEISGNQIRSAFGGYLYELSGDSLNKVYGGLYATFSGNSLTTYDLSERYEISGRIGTQQKLAIAALLFGRY